MIARFVCASAVVGSVFAAPSPAMAADSVACVQLELQSRGDFAGAVDGQLGPEILVAAEAFAAATPMVLPGLTEAVAAEWCHLLRGWDDLTASSVDPPEFANPDPSALPLGLWFDGPVSTAARRLILEDLLWLANIGELKSSVGIDSFLGLQKRATGADLVAWLLLYLHGVSVNPTCLARPTVVVDDEALARDSTDVGVNVAERCDGTGSQFWGFVEYNPYNPRTVARYYDGHVIFTRDEAIPVIHLGDLFLESRSRSFMSRVSRLLTLFHEAHHIAGGSVHVVCSRMNLLGRSIEFGPRGTVLNGYGRNCDTGTQSAYYLDGLMAELLLANCDSCGPADESAIRELAIRAFMRVQIPLGSTQTFENAGLFDGRRGFLVPLRYIPPERFFELQGVEYRESEGRLPTEFVELERIARQLAIDGVYFHEPWVLRPSASITVSADLAMVWLLRAMRSASDGYNVPLANSPPCEQVPIGCREDWWDRIEIIENGNSAAVALVPGSEVRTFRFEIEEPFTGGLILSLAGEGYGAALTMCHVESERCLRRIVGTDGVIIRWPNPSAGVYAVWVDGFGTGALMPDAQPMTLTSEW